jgi:hypothetical protein
MNSDPEMQSATTDGSGELVEAREPNESRWFKWGQEARKNGQKIQDTIIRKLRPGRRQYEEFVDGYDDPNAQQLTLQSSDGCWQAGLSLKGTAELSPRTERRAEDSQMKLERPTGIGCTDLLL